MTPQEILAQTRDLIEEHAEGDTDKWWYCNRFVFARLMLDERKTKTAVKKRLIESNAPCHYCQKPFESKKGVHLHRLDDDQGYRDENCVLMHGECHERYHAENMIKETRAPEETSRAGKAILLKKSKFYDDMSFTYWWDIAPALAERLDKYEAVEFVCKDTGAKCSIPVPELKRLLAKDRQTSRGTGHWGIKVLNGHEEELAFEPGTGSGGSWEFLPVTWSEP